MPLGLDTLDIYRMAEELELAVFEITRSFPKDERFRSVDQLSRSSSSVTNNIAEAYRKRSIVERERILRDICCGEAEETRRNILVCARKGFCAPERAQVIADGYLKLIKATYGFLRYLKTKAVAKDVPNSSTRS